MAFRKLLYVLGVNGTAAGQTATVKIPVGSRFHNFDLFVTDSGAASSAKVNEIRLSMGGTLMQRVTAKELLALYQENLNSANAGHIPIMLSELSRATVRDQEQTAWDTAGESDFEMAVDFDATATNPTLKIAATQDNEHWYDAKTKVITKSPIRRIPLNFNPGAGWFDITQIPTDSKIAAIRINAGTTVTPGDILAYEVYRGQEKVAEGTWDENQKELEALGYDGTQFTLPIIFDRDHRVTNALDCRTYDANGNVTGQTNLTVRVQMASAKPIKVLVDQVRNGFN